MGDRDGVFGGLEFDGALTDRIVLGSLTRLVPPELVDEVVSGAGRTEQRKRRLPARVVVYFVLGLCVFFGDDYGEVIRKLAGGLRRMGSWSDDWDFPSTGSLSKARERLGEEPLRELFHAAAAPVGPPGMGGVFLHGYRLMAVDGTSVCAQDTTENAEEFGYSGTTSEGRSAYPMLRVAALAEAGTHAIIDAEFDGYAHASEQVLARRLARSTEPGMLLIMDAQTWGFATWEVFRATGCDILRRVQARSTLPVARVFGDGSWLSVIPGSPALRRKLHQRLAAGWIEVSDHETLRGYGDLVRAVEYTVENGEKEETVLLITSILDPTEITAVELAAAYHERWEIETNIREIKTTQKGAPVLLRSKKPELVRQELWALLLTHFLIRSLMAEAAETAEADPDRISFIKALRLTRRQVTDQAAFSP